MRNKPRRGLQDIRSCSSLTNEVENPQRKFLRVASLELKKSLCRKVRDAARKRAQEMDEKIVELDSEKAQLLASCQGVEQGETSSVPATHRPGDVGAQLRRGFALRY